MRLRLQSEHYGFNGIFFSATPQSESVRQGDLVDVAFLPQINEFRDERTVQMNVLYSTTKPLFVLMALSFFLMAQ